MNITSKSRYGLKIMMDLATIKTAHTQRGEISSRQGIPHDYMDQILIRLRASGLIESIRGRGGGYRLRKPAGEISVWEIFAAVEDAIQPVKCLDGGHGCQTERTCSSRDAWSDISNAVENSLAVILLSDIVDKRRSTRVPVVADSSVGECRAPRRRSQAAAVAEQGV